MPTQGWDANAFHRQFTRGRTPNTGPTNRGRKALAGALLAVLIVASGAVALAHQAGGEEADAHCHATASETNPDVVLENGAAAEAPGHAAEEADFQATDEGCDEASIASGTCPHTPAPDAASAEEGEAAAEADDVVEDAATTTPESQTPGTAADAPAAAEEAATPDVCMGDAAINTDTTLDGAWFHHVISVASLGPIHARDVAVEQELPDVGGRWQIDETSDEGCTLAGRLVTCDFGDIPVDETREVSLTSARCTLECDGAAESDAILEAANDANDANNLVTSLFEAPACEPTADEGADAAPPESDAGNETPDDGATDAGNASDEAQNDTAEDANATDPQAQDPNATTPETEDPTAEQPTAEEPPAALGDARVLSQAVQDEDDVTLTFVVRNVGQGAAQDVRLVDELPDVRRAWFLGGQDSADCTLSGRDLACWFGDLEPGEERVVFVKAYTDRLPCGQHLVNTAQVLSEGDGNAANDRSSAGIEARGC